MFPSFSRLPRIAGRFRRAALAATLLSTLAVPLGAQQGGALFFDDVRVFDGERVLERRDVLVEDGVVTRISEDLTTPAGAAVVEGAGRTLLPGLIDAHTHTFGEVLREAVAFGVTTQLDMFTDHRFAQAMKEEQEAGGATDRADLYSAGTLVTAPGGHGTQFGVAIPTLTSPDSAQAFVDARIAEGSDWIKLVYEDGHAYGRSIPTLSRATLRAGIEAARRRGKLSVVHPGGAAAAREALEAGADGLVHLFVDAEPEPGFVELARSRGVFVIPTLTVLEGIAGGAGGAPLVEDPRLAPYLLPASRSMLRQGFPGRDGYPEASYEVARETVRRLHAAGIPILAGSDAPNPGTSFGAALHHELELLVEAGLTPAEALAAATSAPARHFRLEDRGRIAPGLRADLLLVEGDPTRDVTATRAVAGVWKRGMPVDREWLARAVAKAQDTGVTAPTGAGGAAGGLVSDFEDGSLGAARGMWMPSPDSYAGGTSTGTVETVEGGAGGSARAMSVSGTITDAVPYAWYGAMWSPGTQPMTPVDLSAHEGLAFRARGDGGTYRLMVFSQGQGMTPLVRTFVAGPEWEEVSVAWEEMGIDGSDVMGVVLAGGPEPGPFGFRVDDFRLR